MRTLLLVVVGCSALAAMAAGVVWTTAPDPVCGGCNVVYISVDPLRADHMGVYGYERNTTPHIDALAEDAYVFDRAYAHSIHTTVSLFSTFSSLYPFQHGVYPRISDPPEVMMVAEVFQMSGFSTLSLNGGANVNGRYGLARGFDRYIQRMDHGRGEGPWISEDEGWERLQGALDGREHDRFFLFFQSFGPHVPYLPPEEHDLWGNRSLSFEAEVRERWNRVVTEEIVKGQAGEDTAIAKFREFYLGAVEQNETLQAHFVAKYDGEIRATDARVGRLLDLLERRGELNETVVVVGSQHGQMLGERGSWRREVLYEEAVRVPLIVSVPGREGQRRIEEVVQNVDIGSTLLRLAVDTVTASYRGFMEQAVGESLVPVMRGGGRGGPVVASQRSGRYDQRVFIEPSSGLKLYMNGSERRVFELLRPGEERLVGREGAVDRLYGRYRSFVDGLERYGEEFPSQWPYFGGDGG